MWSPDAIGRLHKSLLRAAGIDEGVRFHDLRHPHVKYKTKYFSFYSGQNSLDNLDTRQRIYYGATQR